MKISIGIERGDNKQFCDDTALVGESIINDKEIFFDGILPSYICIADGVGGNAGGKDASVFIMQKILTTTPENIEKDNLFKYFQNLNQALVEYGNNISGKSMMATTFTGVFFWDDKVHLVHVGNTRLYSMQGSYLKQLTEDHTTYQWLLNSGQYESAKQCNRNEITGCFGGGNTKFANSMVVKEIFDGGIPNVFVLTSDGIHEYIDIDLMEQILSSGISDKEQIHCILEEANKNGSRDDKTIVIVRR